MKLEDQVTSLELSKRLKELGVKQESLFYWIDNEVFMKASIMFVSSGCEQPDGGPEYFSKSEAEGEIISAFTVAELIEKLPGYIEKREVFNLDIMPIYLLDGKTTYGEWSVGYWKHKLGGAKGFDNKDKKLVNAVAKMLCYLLENKLITL